MTLIAIFLFILYFLFAFYLRVSTFLPFSLPMFNVVSITRIINDTILENILNMCKTLISY